MMQQGWVGATSYVNPNAEQARMYRELASMGLAPHYSANGDFTFGILLPLNFYSDKGELNSTVWYPLTFHVLGHNQVNNDPNYKVWSNAKEFVQARSEPLHSISGFDVSNAVAALNKNADALAASHKKPFYGIGRCVRYVRLALEAGGVNTNPHPVPAKYYGPFLTGWGFHVVTSNIQSSGYLAMRGDVAVFQGFGTDRTREWNGHIQMYNGKQWVSDFRQPQFTPGPGYRSPPAPYIIYRR
jgi:hypothetical protein